MKERPKATQKERLPKYMDVADVIRNKISSGEYKSGELLPSQNEMSELFDVGHNTIREAIGTLVAEQLLYRVHGKGTFVSEQKIKNITIGLSVPNVLGDPNNYHSNIGYDVAASLIHFVEQEARKLGACIILSFFDVNYESERSNLHNMIERKVDGIISLSLSTDTNIDIYNKILDENIPLVFVDRYPPYLDVDYVTTNNFIGTYQVTESIINHGLKDIFMFVTDREATSVQQRIKGLQTAMKMNDLNCSDSIIDLLSLRNGPAYKKDAYSATKQLLEKIKSPLAIFTETAPLLEDVIKAIDEIKIDHNSFILACFDRSRTKLPDSISIIEVLQPLEAISKASVEIIMSKINGDKKSHRLMLAPSISIRMNSDINYK